MAALTAAPLAYYVFASSCLTNAYQETIGSSTYTLLESWTNQAALDAHNESAHFKEHVPKLASCCTAKITKLTPS